MNLNGEEKRIQQLFSDMRSEDRLRAPQFSTVLASAQSGVSLTPQRDGTLRFAIASAMLCLAALIVLFAVMRSSKTPSPTPDDQVLAAPLHTEAPTNIVKSETAVRATDDSKRAPAIKRARHARRTTSLAAAIKSISSWQSPTASLLQTPDDELLRSLPRLGESLQTIKLFSPDQFN